MSNSDKTQVFENENDILKRAEALYNRKDVDIEELKVEFEKLSLHYEELLNQSKIITRVSDRLQNKFNNANQLLAQKNIELKQTIEELTKARVGRKATTIVLVIAMILFIVSEGVIEPIVEKYTSNFFIGFGFKGLIALLLKPLEALVESGLLKTALKKRNLAEEGAPTK